MKKYGNPHALTILLFGFLFSGIGENSFAFDSSNIYRVDPDEHRIHLAVIVDQETRPFAINSTGVKNAVKAFFVNGPTFSESHFASTELIGKIKTSNVIFRPTLFLGNQLSLFLDSGLYNDVDAIISPPFFIGGGGRVTQEIFTDINLSIYGKGHITGRYEFPLNFDMGETYGGYESNMKGRFLMGTLGGVLTTRIPLESMEILPYIGLELSVVRGNATVTKLLIPPETAFLNNVDRNQRDLVISQQDMPFLTLGMTILRPNMSTLRIESKISQHSTSISLGIGVFF